MIKLAKKIHVTKLHWLIDVICGSDGDGCDVTYDIYKDLSDTSIYPASKTILDLTDDSSAPKFLTELRVNFVCKYFKLEFTFDNINYATHPAYILLRNIAVELAVLTDDGLLSEESI